MGVMNGNPKNEPLHYGEVVGIWGYVAANNGLISMYEAFANHAGDKELIAIIEDQIKMMKSENTTVEKILKENGITLPPSLPSRGKASAEEIPAGARFMDPEIAAVLGVNAGQGLVSCSQVLGQCTREDVAMHFMKFHHDRATAGGRLMRLAKEKGWLITPPLHHHNKQEN
ncbi:DUF3231 family protein [Bhargavaea ullalensis]|uniref:DUF3231 family protein n=1 Tax=Bhargavaea ullalensis TaxID=1265685 RepID=A0ABV2G9P4_9BACL